MKNILIVLIILLYSNTILSQSKIDSTICDCMNSDKVSKANDSIYVYGCQIDANNFAKCLWGKLERSDSVSYYISLRDSIQRCIRYKEMQIENYISMKEILKAHNHAIKYGIIIYDHYVTGSDYGIGLKFSLNNLSKKTIKYLYFTVQAFNPVNDPIAGSKIIKCIGPVEPSLGATYDFDNIFYTTVASSLSIQSIKIMFMDGSIKIIPKNIIYELILSQNASYYFKKRFNLN